MLFVPIKNLISPKETLFEQKQMEAWHIYGHMLYDELEKMHKTNSELCTKNIW